MINIKIYLGKDGIISEINASGHAEDARKGNSIVCAAASSLLRTAAKLTERENDIKLTGAAEKKGVLFFKITDYPENKHKWLKGVTDYLILGLEDLSSEYPDDCKIYIKQLK